MSSSPSSSSICEGGGGAACTPLAPLVTRSSDAGELCGSGSPSRFCSEGENGGGVKRPSAYCGDEFPELDGFRAGVDKEVAVVADDADDEDSSNEEDEYEDAEEE